MQSTYRRWLPAIMKIRTPLLCVAGLAAVAGVAPSASVSLAANETGTGSPTAAFVSTKPATPGAATPGQPNKGQTTPGATTATDQAAKLAAALAGQPETKVLAYEFQLQPNYYYCGPAATRIALSAHSKALSQTAVAGLLGTTVYGTDSAFNVTRALNSQLGANHYQTREIPNRTATSAQMDQLQADIVTAIAGGDVLVANVAGTVSDTLGGVHSYPGGHYLTVVGYADQGRTATIADPADPLGDGSYHLSTIDLTNWMATRGYSY